MKHIPFNIREAVSGLLRPYGISFANIASQKNNGNGVNTEPVWLTIKDAENISGLKRPTLGRLIRCGTLNARKLGHSKSSKVLISRKSLLDFIDDLVIVREGGAK